MVNGLLIPGRYVEQVTLPDGHLEHFKGGQHCRNFGPIFEQNASINFEPTLEKSVNFGRIFKKVANSHCQFHKDKSLQ